MLDSVKKESTVSTYYAYNLKGSDKNGNFDCFRRYNEFYTLRSILLQQWPGCFIPPIPAKKKIGNKKDAFVEIRKRHLNYFCTKVAELPHLFYSNEFQLFLRSQETDVTKSLLAYPKHSYTELVTKFKDTFPILFGVTSFYITASVLLLM